MSNLRSCTGAGQYAFMGSVEHEDGANTGVCPECDTRQPCDLDGFVKPHLYDPEELRRRIQDTVTKWHVRRN